MALNFGTYRNQYGRIVTDRGPSQGQVDFLAKLVAEKICPNDYIATLIDAFHAEELSGRNASVLIDALMSANSTIVAPSTLGAQEGTRMASEKQLSWVQRLCVARS